MTDRALIVFAKEPRPGRVKTRMCPPLDPTHAAALYECMLDDVLEESAAACVQCGAALYVTVDPAQATESIARRAPSAAQVIAQHGADLAARMQYAIAEAAAAGFARIVLRGSDSPAVPRQRIADAFEALAEVDVVISRDADGGYDLLGVRRPHAGLLDHKMSTASVADETLACAARLGLRSVEIEAGFDLDTGDDLLHLRDVRGSLAPGLARRTLARLDAEGWWPQPS